MVGFRIRSKRQLFVRIDRRRKLPATIILRAMDIGTEEILDMFFDKDTVTQENGIFKVYRSWASARWNSALWHQRWRRQRTETGRRISARHTRQMEKQGLTSLEVPAEFLMGRVYATLSLTKPPVKSSLMLTKKPLRKTERLMKRVLRVQNSVHQWVRSRIYISDTIESIPRLTV